jgi:hypothetical protein
MQERCETGQTNLWLARKDYVDEQQQYSRDGFTLMNGMFDSAVENRPSGPAHERHYTVNEIAEMWNLAYNTVKAMFKNEPGVFAIGSEETRYGRPRITLRIPESVLLRVYKKRTRVM